jgi:hypothetical protein
MPKYGEKLLCTVNLRIICHGRVCLYLRVFLAVYHILLLFIASKGKAAALV